MQQTEYFDIDACYGFLKYGKKQVGEERYKSDRKREKMHKWTDEQVEVLQQHAGKMSCLKIGKLIGLSKGKTRWKMLQLGLDTSFND